MYASYGMDEYDMKSGEMFILMWYPDLINLTDSQAMGNSEAVYQEIWNHCITSENFFNMNPSSVHLLQCPHRDKLQGKQHLGGFLVENCICETHFYVEDL